MYAKNQNRKLKARSKQKNEEKKINWKKMQEN